MELHLQAHREAIRDDPVAEFARRLLAPARREEHAAARGQAVLPNQFAAPFVVRSVANHELDDVLVLGAGDFESHMKDVDEVLRRLKKRGMQINAVKSYWGKSEVEYLGFTISRLFNL